MCSSHLKCKVANKGLNARERVEVVKRDKDGASFPLLSHESLLSVKENQIEKEKNFQENLFLNMNDLKKCFAVMFNPLVNGTYIRRSITFNVRSLCPGGNLVWWCKI